MQTTRNEVDELEERCRDVTNEKERARLQTQYGFNLCPNGLLKDRSLRALYKPVDHTLRDWQHTICGDGIANSILGETLNKMKALRYPMQTVRDFMMECTLPSKYGKAHANININLNINVNINIVILIL